MSSFKKLPLIFMVSLVLFFIIGFGLERTDLVWRFFYVNSRPATDHFLRKAAELRLIKEKIGEERVFLVGSSVTYEGYDEDYLNREAAGKGMRFYNFGSGGVTPPWLFLLRKDYIARRPDLVVWPVYVGDFYGRPDYASLKYFFKFEILPRIASYVGFRELYGHKGEIFDAVIAEILPFYRYNKSIIRSFETAIGDRILGVRREAPLVTKKTGTQPPSFFDNIAASEVKFAKTEYTELNKKLFLDFIRDLKAAGVKVLIVGAPMNSRITSISAAGLETELDEWLRTAADEHNFIYIGARELPVFSDDEFVDFSHLNEWGRDKNSRFLLEYLMNMTGTRY